MSSSKKVTVGYRLFSGIHYILCKGPIDRILKIRAEKKTLWGGINEGLAGRPISISASNVFGGDPPEGEGGVSGDVDIDMGGSGQTANGYLASVLGNIPAYRGVVGAILNQVYVSASRYIKPWEILGQRIHVRQAEGTDQWYIEKAAIASRFDGPQALFFIVDFSDAMNEHDGQPISRFAAVQMAILDLLDEIDQVRILSSVRLDIGICFYSSPGVFFESYKFDASTSDIDDLIDFVENIGLAGGVPVSPVEGYTSASEFYETVSTLSPASRNACIHVTGDAHVTTAAPAVSAGAFMFQDSSRVAIYGVNIVQANILFTSQMENTAGDSVPVLQGVTADVKLRLMSYIFYNGIDLNPAHIMRECLTDLDFGLGLDDDEIDENSFQYAADLLYSERMGMSLIWDGQIEIDEFIQEVARHIDASLDIDFSTGKARLKLIRNDYDLDSGVITLGPDEIDRVEDYAQATWGDQVNAITVVYEDGPTGEKATVTIPDTAAVQRQGRMIATTIQYPGFSNRSIAARVAERDLRTLKARVRTCTIYATRAAASLRMGDVFILNWPELGFDSAVMRVEKADLGDPRSGQVRISVVDDVFTISDTAAVGSADPEWTNPSGDALPAPEHLAVEAPYYEAVQRQGQTAVDLALSSNSLLGYLIAAGTRPTQRAHINSTLSVDAGSGYEESETVDFSPLVYLVSDVSEHDTVFPVSDDVDLDLVTIGTFAQIADEIIVIESIDSDSLVVGRGALDTIPASYSGSASLPIIFWDEYGGTDNTEYVDGQSVNVKLLTSTGSDQLSSASAPVDSVTFNQRAFRPYPPGNLKVNAEYFPETINGTSELILTWAHRDRTQQTSSSLIDFFDSDVGPETGVTYTLDIFGEEDTLLRSVTGITSNNYTYASADERDDSELLEGDEVFTTVLLNMNGADGSTTFTDELGHTFTAQNNAQIDTAEFKFGGASGLFDAASHIAASSADFILNNDDFTISFWMKTPNAGGDSSGRILEIGGTSVNGSFIISRFGSSNPFRFYIRVYNGVYQDIISTGTVANDTWTFIAVVRESNNYRLYIDGILSGSDSNSSAITQSDVYIGDAGDNIAGYNGWLDDFQIQKGIALYSSNFTPPTQEATVDIGSKRLNGRLRFELKSVREEGSAAGGDIDSLYKYDVEVRRPGWNFNWNLYWGGGTS